MYILYIFLLLTSVYIIPALAFFPRLAFSTSLIGAIPVVSFFIIAVIQIILSYLNLYHQSSLIIISFLLFCIAAFNIVSLHKKGEKFEYEKNHLILISLIILILFPFFIEMGLDSFSNHDEIYSWNMWAVQHFYGEPVDLYYTRSPYPQFFSILLSYCYKLLGNIELQMPIRFLLPIFPLSMLITIATSSKKLNRVETFITMVVLLLLIFGTDLYRRFNTGLADPVMASALIVSVCLYIHFTKENKISFLWLSLMCGIAGSYTKQPALMWSFLVFPAIVFTIAIKNKINIKKSFAKTSVFWIIGISSILLSALWIFGEGYNFYHNTGVIKRSIAERTILEQILFSSNQYFIQKPIFLFLLIIAGISVHTSKKYYEIFWLLLTPSLIAWFIWGAYDLRLGMHVIALTALLIISLRYKGIIFFDPNRDFWKKLSGLFYTHWQKIWVALFCTSIIIGSVNIYKTYSSKSDGLNLSQGGRHTIEKYFGDISDFVYKELYNNPDLLLWVPSNYIYGIFYRHTRMIRPDHSPYTEDKLMDEIKKYKPDYLFYSGNVYINHNSNILLKLTEKYPFLFNEIESRDQLKLGYRIFKLNKDHLEKSETIFN